ncbi:MAG: hypothetical protein V4594_11630 [Bacteroidota bacterium]
MRPNNRFILKLSFLLVPFSILTLVLHDGSSSGGVGGGGYDLSGLVYGSLLFICILIWLLWMLISYFTSKIALDQKLHLILLAIGIAALVAAWFITPRML